MTYDIFKDKPISHKIDLVELHLKKECTGWAAEDGAYKCTFNDVIDNAPIDIDGVEGDGTALTEAASITEVKNNPDRWFQDTANNLLYVSFTGGAEADTKTVIAIFKVYFATEGYIGNPEPELLTDGDMEAATTAAWLAYQTALEKVTSPVHGGSKAMKVTLSAGQTVGDCGQAINVIPIPVGASDVFSFRVWLRNGNLTTGVFLVWGYYDGSWHWQGGTTPTTGTTYVEHTLLRKSVPAGTSQIKILLKVTGAEGQYGYFDDASIKKYAPIYYLPRIPEDGVRLDCSSDYVDSGSLTLLNGDGLFDTKLGDWIWRGCSCTVKRGGDDLTYAQYEAMGDFLITSLDYNSNEIALNLKGIKLNWNKRLPLNEFYTAEEILKPESNGTYTGWAAEGGAAWQCVADEVESLYGDKFGTYIKLTSGSAKASFNLPASSIPAGAVINFVTLYVVGGVALNETHEMKLLIKIGVTESTKSFGHYWAHSNSWCEKVHSWATNPADGEAWEITDINALEIGVEGDPRGWKIRYVMLPGFI